jgi:hypothetical protein
VRHRSTEEVRTIKVLVATSKTQGMRESDHHRCVEGELVWFPPMCDSGLHDPDGECGCCREFGGLNSHRATTTAMVRTIEGFSREDYAEALASSMVDQGHDPSLAPQLADAMVELVAELADGVVVERRMVYVQTRPAPV